ncbi:LPD7 domain-containing protein [Terasakiella sp.]|uniref:LPD7 domain-containing protein n=1 Tax=Terasakiella sp. TaxID=2034861 RepID=UPI003AA87754
MIINGSTRGTSWADIEELCQHLLNVESNEEVEVNGVRHCLNHSLQGSLKEMRFLSLGSRSKKSVYHSSISAPRDEAERLSDKQWLDAVDVLENEMGFQGHQRAIVFHKKNGRKHAHVIWGMVNPSTLKAASTSWNYVKHERAARKIEQRFNLKKVQGVHVQSDGKSRPRSTFDFQDVQSSERTGQDLKANIQMIAQAWEQSQNGQSFKDCLATHNLTLSQGQRGFIVVDGGGNCHSIARRLKLKKRDVEHKLSDISLNDLPTVEEVKSNLEKFRQLNSKHSGERKMRIEKQVKKVALLKKAYPNISIEQPEELNMVDTSQKGLARIQLKDKTWVIDKGGKIHVFGKWTEENCRLSRALAEAKDCEIETHEDFSKMSGKPAGKPVSLEECLMWWKEQGATALSATNKGVWVSWNGVFFLDQGNSVTIFEPITEEAIKKMVETAKARWGDRVQITGSEEFKQMYWAEAQRQGIKVVNYEPPEKFRLEQELRLNQDIRIFLTELSRTGSFEKAKLRKIIPKKVEKKIKKLHMCNSNPLGEIEYILGSARKSKKYDFISYLEGAIIAYDINKKEKICNLDNNNILTM